MNIIGLPGGLLENILALRNVKEYFQALSENPSHIHTGESDGLIDIISDPKLRHAIEHIGKHNALPPTCNLRELTNSQYVKQYEEDTKQGIRNLWSMMHTVMDEFMPDKKHSNIWFSKQIALYCKGCGEYKASGMFDFKTEEQSEKHEYDIDMFSPTHILDSDRTYYVARGPQVKLPEGYSDFYCVPCQSDKRSNLVILQNGAHASARKFFYPERYIEYLKRKNALPKVLSVGMRVKETKSFMEKAAYQLSVKKSKESKHFKILEDKREKLESVVGKEFIETLLAKKNGVYDRFGLRIVTGSVDQCYGIFDWLQNRFSVIRSMDYIKDPKEDTHYRSLHATILYLRYDMDIQIRTREMDYEAEYGIAKMPVGKGRQEMVDKKFSLAATAFRYHLFGV